MPIFLVLGILNFSISVFAATHSLKYFYTGTSGANGFPEFITVGMIDEEQFTYYDNFIKRETPRQSWVMDAVDPDYWDRNTQICVGAEQQFKVNVDTLNKRFNQTGGIHTLQNMYGCELDDDGTTRGFDQYGYDGDDYLSFDKQTLTWIAASQRALTSKGIRDAEMANNQYLKGYYEGTCIEWLKKYVEYGSNILKRKVQPEGFLTHKITQFGTEVTCHVTGFFPRAIEVVWHNGGPRDLDIESGEVLPNEDGTFQVKKTLKLTKKPKDIKKDDYTCRVAHSSLPDDKIFRYDPAMRNPNEPNGNGSFPIWIIVVVVGILLAAALGVGLFIWKKKSSSGDKNPKYIQTSTGENSSTGSSNEA
ncbi:H-2 class I histocompatibility antigen, Q9 alpha chain-like [Erpetoichthys calabaricus]|uniref:H-2 class I histocompatibility antigen, Q9 alpha chain-like n=1 Tax=Erpetoichthys calabaricus TaxID=27687 RepID=A0A8C4X5T9_ERPCA|nr:H-2 class I histocompatibility antigen, Q9 alpha chain-like [Erpetoichthys calabaricus]